MSRRQQVNVCSADELIEGADLSEDVGNVFAKYQGSSEKSGAHEAQASVTKGQLELFAEIVGAKFGELVDSQRELNGTMQKSFGELVQMQQLQSQQLQSQQSSGQLNMPVAAAGLEVNSSFQIQLQLQQMMMNMT